MRVIRGAPAVSVPVLSSMTVSIVARPSTASARITSTPSWASRELAAAIAAGVASDSAQGHVATSTASIAGKARVGSISCQITPTSTVSNKMRTTNHDAMRSAASPRRGRSLCARSSKRTSSCKVDSPGRRLTRKPSAPPALTAPPGMASCRTRRCGSDSPLSSDSSIKAPSLVRVPSTGITWPVLTRSRSPTRSAVSGTRSTTPSSARIRCAMAGSAFASASVTLVV